MDNVVPDRPAEPVGGVRHGGDVAAGLRTTSSTAPRGQLRLSAVGNRIDVIALGALDGASFDHIASRLDRLLAGGPGCLHVDCSQVVSIDPSVVGLFVQARDRLQSVGATLELVGPPRALQLAMTPCVPARPGGAAPTPSAAAAT